MSSLPPNRPPSSSKVRANSPAVDFSLLESLEFDRNYLDAEIKTDKSVMYICYLKEPSLIMIDKKAIKAIRYLSYEVRQIAIRERMKVFLKYETFVRIIVSILKYYRKELEGILSSQNISDFQDGNGFYTLHKLQLEFFSEFLSFIVGITNLFRPFVYKFHDEKGTKAILNYLNNDILMDKLPAINDSILIILVNVTPIADNRQKDFEKYKIVSIIEKLLKTCKNNQNLMRMYVMLANIVKDKEISNLPNIQQALKCFATETENFVNQISTKRTITRISIDVESDESDKPIIMNVFQNWTGWHVFEILHAVTRLAVNDETKSKVYEDFEFKNYLEKLILHGNDDEKACAMKLLFQVCFNEEIAKKVKNNKQLFDLIKTFSTSTTNVFLKKYTSGLVWTVNKLEDSSKVQVDTTSVHSVKSKQEEHSKKQEKQKHIMISYNCGSRAECLKLKGVLEQHNFPVWIDVSDMHGSTLESMAIAVEESICVIVSMSESYKQSPYCRLEAEYAIKLNKPIIPLIVQSDYKPDGWLGIILGMKKYFDFKKHVTENFIKIIEEINSIKSDAGVVRKQSVPRTYQNQKPINTEKTETFVMLEKWTVDDVNKWLKNVNIEPKIIEIIKQFDGKNLISFKSISKEAPDYFYQVISNSNQINVLAVINFKEEFEKLFLN